MSNIPSVSRASIIRMKKIILIYLPCRLHFYFKPIKELENTLQQRLKLITLLKKKFSIAIALTQNSFNFFTQSIVKMVNGKGHVKFSQLNNQL